MAERFFSSLAAKKEFERRKAQEISMWVIAHLNETIEISHLLEASGLTQFELVRIFEIYLKTTTMQWIRQQKKFKSQGNPSFEFREGMEPEKKPTPYIPENIRKR